MEWENRPPAKYTLEKLKEQDKINKEFCQKDNHFDKAISIMTERFDELTRAFNQINEDNKEQHRKIMSDIGVLGAQNKALYEELKSHLENNYATKESSWAEKVLAWVGGIIITIVVVAFMVLIIKDGLIK